MKKVIKKIIVLLMSLVLLMHLSPICVLAKDEENLPQKYQISSSKREKVLLAQELNILPNQIRNIRKKTFNSTTTNQFAHIATVDSNGNSTSEPVDIEITEVLISDNISPSQQSPTNNYRPAKYTVLKASETKTTQKSKKGLEGSITWIDNFGPLNELTNVYGHADPEKYSYICKYSYGVGGLAGSIVTKKIQDFT